VIGLFAMVCDPLQDSSATLLAPDPFRGFRPQPYRASSRPECLSHAVSSDRVSAVVTRVPVEPSFTKYQPSLATGLVFSTYSVDISRFSSMICSILNPLELVRLAIQLATPHRVTVWSFVLGILIDLHYSYLTAGLVWFTKRFPRVFRPSLSRRCSGCFSLVPVLYRRMTTCQPIWIHLSMILYSMRAPNLDQVWGSLYRAGS